MKSGHKNSYWIISTCRALAVAAGFIWQHRLRIGIMVGVWALFYVTTSMPFYTYGPIWTALLGGLVYDFRHDWVAAKFLGVRLRSARVRRQLVNAARDSGFSGLKVSKITPTLPGELVSVKVPRGQTVERLMSLEKPMRSCLEVSDVRVVGDRENRALANISIIRRDPFATMHENPWPLMDAERVNIRNTFPFGLDEYGNVVNARLLSRNIILGGAPDAGKSAALRVLTAAAVLDPTARVWMMDAKPGAVEFIHWEKAAYKLVRGRDLEAAVEMLAELEQRVEDRYKKIVDNGNVFVTDDMEIDVLFIDELPQYMRSFETDTTAQASFVKTIRGSIWKLIAMGRAAGMITALSAQKPTADIIPTESRDLIDHKFALHCNTRQMSDAILGAGAGEEAPANAAEIPSGQPGVGFYVGDNGVQKIRAFYISPKQALEIADRVMVRDLNALTQEA